VSKEALSFGAQAEDLAADFLRKEGYKILARNYRSRLGEIDIIARDKDTLVFIEVKARHNDRFGEPSEAVARRKQRQISKAALAYLKEQRLFDQRARFDVLSVFCSGAGTPRFDLIKNAFDLDEKFTY
jgi:putative endonuclease